MGASVNPIDLVLPKLVNVKPTGDRKWQASCPGHDDQHASLSVTVGDDDRVLLHCHAGCTTEAIVAAMGLRLADLFVRRDGTGKKSIIATYDYLDDTGELLFQAVRYDPKDFKQRRPDGQGGYIWNLQGARLVLYRLPELIDADPAKMVFDVEGEKDVDALHKLGFIATCNPMGAGKWKPEYSETLRGRHVVIIADKDNAGRCHAEQVAASLNGKAADVRIIELPGNHVKDASDWISAGGTAEQLRQIVADAPEWHPTVTEPTPEPEPATPTRFLLTDYGNAQRLVARHGQDLRYNVNRSKWMAYDGLRWNIDEWGEATLLAKESSRSMWREAADENDPRRRDELLKHAKKSEQRQSIEAALILAQSEPTIPVSAADLDRDPMQFNVENGIVDLATGKLLEHRREHLLSKLAPVAYDPTAGCPLWIKVLDRIIDGNQDLIAYLQRIAGLCLTGDISVQEMWILWGAGANGKNVFVDTLMGLMGDYAGLAADSLLTMRTHDEHPTELADLQGKRLVVGSETEAGARLRIQLIKRLTGNPTIKARYMRENFIEFQRTHKLVLITNNKPVIHEATNAVWRRLRLVPFTVTIPGDEQDVNLTAKLRAEWPGILNWAVRGCLDWQRQGMCTPLEVTSATATYQAESDPLGEFVSMCCIVGDIYRVARTELFVEYLAWAKSAGESHPMDRTTFYEAVRRLTGVEDGRVRIAGTPTNCFKGVGLCKVASEGFGGVST